MHIKLLVSAVIAALIWTASPAAVSEPIENKAAEPQASTAQTVAAPTQEEAEATALAHAGLTADQVTRLHTERDFDNGIEEFEVEFRHGDWEYDYTLRADTLEILKHSKEYDPPETKPVETTPKETQPAETTPKETQPAETKRISAEEAKAIALAHAGLTADQVKGLRSEYDRDDGKPVYEIEFRVGNWEYDYEIHAETGKILDWEKDWDD